MCCCLWPWFVVGCSLTALQYDVYISGFVSDVVFAYNAGVTLLYRTWTDASAARYWLCPVLEKAVGAKTRRAHRIRGAEAECAMLHCLFL